MMLCSVQCNNGVIDALLLCRLDCTHIPLLTLPSLLLLLQTLL